MKSKKKAFTLTELLVVVIVIGVLSAAVLPKFNKIIETRKTTEAEELMAAVRTEQEKRCALDKPYLMQMSELTDVVKNNDTNNFTITLASRGIDAESKGKYSYTLKMLSYADGRICCDGTACSKLNKNYPTCEELKTKADYQESPADCAGETPAPSCDGSHYQGEKSVKSCECGTVSATWSCNASTGYVWKLGVYPACPAKPSAERKACGNGYTGEQTRSAVCKNGVWDWSEWTDTCTLVCDMNNPAVSSRAQTCEMGGHNPNWVAGYWNKTSCSCECSAGGTLDHEGACIFCNKLAEQERYEGVSHSGHTGTWNMNTCSCDCPAGTSLDSLGECTSNCYNTREQEACERPSHTGHTGVWNLDTCSCTCPAGTSLDTSNGECIGCWDYYKYDAKKAEDACISAGGNWGDCWCQCPQGSLWDRKLKQCVTSECSDELAQAWGQDIYWCTKPSEAYGVSGTWNPTDCKCSCPFPYYHEDQGSCGCVLAPGYSEDDRDNASCGNSVDCEGWDQDAWDAEQDRLDQEFEDGADRDYDYDYDYDGYW